MCVRFALYSVYPKFAHRIGELRADDPPLPRYNVAPGTWISAILRRSDDQQLALDDVWWAISRNGRGEKAPQPINARIETVTTSKFYQVAFQRHCCLILTDERLEPWLDSALTDRDTISRFVRHMPSEAITHWTVSARVNKLGERRVRIGESKIRWFHLRF